MAEEAEGGQMMKWATDIPTQPGWYWWQFPDDQIFTRQIVQIYTDESGNLCVQGKLLSELDIVGQWQGPLKPEE